MTILYVITELYEGGAENALWEVARRVHDKGHTVRVVCLYGRDGAVADRLQESGMPVRQLGRNLISGFLKLPKLRSEIGAFKPDIVHSWLFHPNFACRLVRPRRTPLICSLRVYEPRKSHILLDRWTRRRVSMYIANSDDVADFVVKRLRVSPDVCRTIPNGVDVASFQPDEAEQSLSRPEIYGLTVGRIDPQKGQDILIRALAKLPADIPWQWHFAGSVTDRRYARRLYEFTHKAGIADKIYWHGQMARTEITELYKQANLFALSSRWEGQPNAVLEAMAARVPVLASLTHGVHELVETREGSLWKVSPNEPDAWAEALMGARQAPDALRTQSDAGLELVQGRTWSRTAEQHLSVYETVAGTHSKRSA